MNKFLKYFLCILICILSINFIVNLYSFITNYSNYLLPSKIDKNPTSETLLSMGKELQNTLDNTADELKQKYGENYPASGIIYYKAILHYSSVTIIQNFIFSTICGFAIGNIIYFLFIAKLKSYKLILLLILILFISSIFLALSDIITYTANGETIKFGLSEIFWNMEATAIPYIIACLILCGINKIYTVYVEIQNS